MIGCGSPDLGSAISALEVPFGSDTSPVFKFVIFDKESLWSGQGPPPCALVSPPPPPPIEAEGWPD